MECSTGFCRPLGRTGYEGYSKHDGLNSPVLARLAGDSRLRRLGAIQVVTRSPVDVRPLVGVRKARNAKGLSLFARALLARHRMTGSADDATRGARVARLADRPSRPGIRRGCAGVIPIPGRTSGSSPRGTSRTGWSPRSSARPCSTGTRRCRTSRYLDAAGLAVRFLLDAPKTLFEDDDRWCLSYVPDRDIDWIVMDVSALAGALAARLGAIAGDSELDPRGRPARPLRGLQADRLWRLVLRRPAVGQPHHPRQLPHRLHPRRDPAVRAGAPAVTSSSPPTAGASSSTSGGCSSRAARPGS